MLDERNGAVVLASKLDSSLVVGETSHIMVVVMSECDHADKTRSVDRVNHAFGS